MRSCLYLLGLLLVMLVGCNQSVATDAEAPLPPPIARYEISVFQAWGNGGTRKYECIKEPEFMEVIVNPYSLETRQTPAVMWTDTAGVRRWTTLPVIVTELPNQ